MKTRRLTFRKILRKWESEGYTRIYFFMGRRAGPLPRNRAPRILTCDLRTIDETGTVMISEAYMDDTAFERNGLAFQGRTHKVLNPLYLPDPFRILMKARR